MALKQLADQVRDIPLEHILKTFGFDGRKEGTHVIWRKEGYAINTIGQKWFDHKSHEGGGGAIDLAIYLLKKPYKEAVIWLSDMRGIEAVHSPVATSPTPDRTPFPELMAKYAKRDDSQWSIGRDYLVKTRCLDPGMVDELYDKGMVYTNDHKPNPSLVFLHKDIYSGKVTGATLRDTKHQSIFKPTFGDKKQAFFTIGDFKTAEYIAVVESPIDALSYYQLKEPKKTAIVSISGSHIPEALEDHIFLTQGKKLIFALDKDTAGDNEHRRIWDKTIDIGADFIAHTPIEKDWNAELIATVKASRITSPVQAFADTNGIPSKGFKP